MKAYKTLIFIVIVFILLSLLGFAIPNEGIEIGDMNIKFPSAKKIMESSIEEDDEKIDYVHQELEDGKAIYAYIEEQKLSADKKYRLETIRHKNAIIFPNDSIEWFDNFFAALEDAKNRPMRIIHYGDSQIEEDRISSDLRALFQKQFGGYGVGLIPAIQSIPTSAIGQKCSDNLEKYIVYGNKDTVLEQRNYGVLGQTVQLNGNVKFSFYKVNLGSTKPTTKKFGNITILLNEVKTPVTATISYGSNKKTEKAEILDSYIKFVLPDSTTKAEITISGIAKIDGFVLDGNENGVSLDNVAMRGCSGTIFTSISKESLKKYYDKYNVPLIILQFGGNSIPYTKTENAIKKYCNLISRQLQYLHKVAPNSKILFIGPSDMSTKVNGNMESYPQIPNMITALKKICAENDAAYWDLYKAMGGKNSMVQWVNSNPPLAGEDHIHFTYRGAKKASEILYESFMTAYKYYEYRKEK